MCCCWRWDAADTDLADFLGAKSDERDKGDLRAALLQECEFESVSSGSTAPPRRGLQRSSSDWSQLSDTRYRSATPPLPAALQHPPMAQPEQARRPSLSPPLPPEGQQSVQSSPEKIETDSPIVKKEQRLFQSSVCGPETHDWRIKEGWLSKKSRTRMGVGVWQRRYWRTHNSYLQYFTNKVRIRVSARERLRCVEVHCKHAPVPCHCNLPSCGGGGGAASDHCGFVLCVLCCGKAAADAATGDGITSGIRGVLDLRKVHEIACAGR